MHCQRATAAQYTEETVIGYRMGSMKDCCQLLGTVGDIVLRIQPLLNGELYGTTSYRRMV